MIVKLTKQDVQDLKHVKGLLNCWEVPQISEKLLEQNILAGSTILLCCVIDVITWKRVG